jgi:hypothetical protein
MSNSREQRVCIKFYFKLGKTTSETHDMLWTAFGEAVYQEHKHTSAFQEKMTNFHKR